MSTFLSQYTIYDHPRDYPEGFVVRQWRIGPDEIVPGEAWAASTLEEARELVPFGLFRVSPSDNDDPVIVETWT